MGSERGGGAGFSIGHIDALHATTNNVQRFRCKVASYDAWHQNCFVASSVSLPSPCPCICLTVSSLFVLLGKLWENSAASSAAAAAKLILHIATFDDGAVLGVAVVVASNSLQ